MKAAVYYGPRDIRTEEVEKPKITDNEILVKVKACGICGSDLHCYKFGLFSYSLLKHLEPRERGIIMPGQEPSSEPISFGPGIPGHEYSGEVVEVGNAVQGIVKGDRIGSWINGGMAEYTNIPVFPGTFSKLPPEVSYEEGATLEPLANSLHAIRKGKPLKGENVVVFGMGAIGMGVIQCLKTLNVGLNKIIAVDLSDYRLNIAKELGADEIINATKVNPIAKVVELVGPDQASLLPMVTPIIDIVYDCVGYIKETPGPSVLQQAINMVRIGKGRIIAHGIFEEPLTLQLIMMVAKEVSILGSFGMNQDDREYSIQLMQSKSVDRSKIISHEFPLNQAKEAFEMACNIDESVKVLVKP